ncbi:hypothetical protein MGN01_41670 [Methylobacterium gnaphalii]|uniref:Uncharacterized protein n=1 Tax=Methylobacterium gnaphalii TaxID=1010610 RepID=A0A512JQV9_9HYPH|nr:hypothetical protein MGN01_41670 [Methylobacterium gnaphalii]GLS50895.1 hypothetical protein GCM10007885_37490 [Methylobacterium gnaphalii]
MYADQAAFSDGASVKDSGVPYGDILAYIERMLAIDVKDSAVLDVRSSADGDAVVVAAKYGTRPDADACFQPYLADHSGARCHISIWVDVWANITQSIYGHPMLQLLTGRRTAVRRGPETNRAATHQASPCPTGDEGITELVLKKTRDTVASQTITIAGVAKAT